MGEEIVSSIINGGKLLFCGNGGSAADAQHLAAELLVRLRPNYNRKGLPAISLSLWIPPRLLLVEMTLVTMNYFPEL